MNILRTPVTRAHVPLTIAAFLRRLIISLTLAGLFLAPVEIILRTNEQKPARMDADDLARLAGQIARTELEGRERDAHFMKWNFAAFLQHPSPTNVDTAYVGSSRTRLLRPMLFGRSHQVIAAGNSYNEMPYGVLAEAIATKALFPNIKRIFVEASLLLRRPPPPRYGIESDHIQYIPFLEPVLNLEPPPGLAKFLNDTQSSDAKPWWHLRAFSRRDELRLSRLLQNGKNAGALASEHVQSRLDFTGEWRSPPYLDTPKALQPPPILATNIKVQRLQPVLGWHPWDSGFELWAKWARAQNIDIVFFEPPVRSDLLAYKRGLGLAEHKADLKRVAEKYGFPYVDFNREEAGFSKDWSLFNNEDHLETCKGIAIIFAGLDEAYKNWKAEGTLVFHPQWKDIMDKLSAMPAPCQTPQV